MSTSRDRYGVGADRVNDINDDQLRVIRTLLGTLLLIRQPADARRGLWQSEEVRPAAAARKRLRRAGAEHPDAPVRYITLRQSIRPAPDGDRWGDMLRVAGSLTLGEVRGHDLIRMLSRDGKPSGLGDAFAHYGRIFKTLHLLQFVSDEGYRRMIGAQLNVTEARHRLAREIFFGQRGELRQHYREGMEDQLGALGLALNAVVLFNSLYIDAAVKQLAADGFPVTDELLARLSPLQYDHINFLGRYAFTRPPAPGLRQLRDPHSDDETDDGGQD